MVPILHRIRERKRNISKSMTLLPGLPVRIEPMTNMQTGRHTGKLGNMRIGEYAVPGGSYRDGLYDAAMVIEDIPQERIPEFLEGGKGGKA